MKTSPVDTSAALFWSQEIILKQKLNKILKTFFSIYSFHKNMSVGSF